MHSYFFLAALLLSWWVNSCVVLGVLVFSGFFRFFGFGDFGLLRDLNIELSYDKSSRSWNFIILLLFNLFFLAAFC